MNNEEIWKLLTCIDTYSQYEISNLGHIRNKRLKKIMSGCTLKDGVVVYTLRDKTNKKKNYKGHILVAKTFIPNPDHKQFVIHKNKLSDDNRVENLMWSTGIPKRGKNRKCFDPTFDDINDRPSLNQELDGEIWKNITSFEEYQISSYGRIKTKSGKITLGSRNKRSGYCSITMEPRNGKTVTRRVHCIVAEHFVNNPNNHQHIRHINGDVGNNHCSNLVWYSKVKDKVKNKPNTDIYGEEWRTMCYDEDPESEIEISNFGRIKMGEPTYGQKRSDGYMIVYFGCGDSRRIHRLVAQAFIPNPDGLPCVNHKDGNKSNNRTNNLEWCSHQQNSLHAFATGLSSNSTLMRAVAQYTRSGQLVKQFNAVRTAAQETGINYGNIGSCVSGARHTAGGYVWRYIDEISQKNEIPESITTTKGPGTGSAHKRQVIQFDLKTKEEITRFDSLKEAQEKTKINRLTISKCCRGQQRSSGGYGWKFSNP